MNAGRTPGSAALTAGPAVSGRWVRVVTVGAVLLVAAVAAVVSYAHMQQVARDAGEGWRAGLLPLSVDGLVVAASMVLLTRRGAGLPGGWLAWSALLGGVGASLAANVAAAEPTATARTVAGWPAVAFAVAFELLLSQRRTTAGDAPPAPQGDPAQESEPVSTGHPPPAAPVAPKAPAELEPAEPVPPAARTPDPASASVPPRTAAEPDGVDLPARIAALVREAEHAGRPTPGRRRMAAQLGVTEHAIRTAGAGNGAASEGGPR